MPLENGKRDVFHQGVSDMSNVIFSLAQKKYEHKRLTWTKTEKPKGQKVGFGQLSVANAHSRTATCMTGPGTAAVKTSRRACEWKSKIARQSTMAR